MRRYSGLRGIMRVCGLCFPAPSSLTCHIWVLHEQEEAITQGCADRLGARKEKVQCGHYQVLQVELCVGVLLFLQGGTASGLANSPVLSDSKGGKKNPSCARPFPRLLSLPRCSSNTLYPADFLSFNYQLSCHFLIVEICRKGWVETDSE